MTGKYLEKSEFCKIGNLTITETIIDTTSIICKAPKVYSESIVNIEVYIAHETLDNILQWTQSGLTFAYFKTPEIASIIPAIVYGTPEEPIIVTGNNFQYTTDSVCYWSDGQMSPSIWHNSTQMLCYVPQISGNNIQLTVGTVQYDNRTYANFTQQQLPKPYIFGNPLPNWIITEQYATNITLTSTLATQINSDNLYCLMTCGIQRGIKKAIKIDNTSVTCEIPAFFNRINNITIVIYAQEPNKPILFDDATSIVAVKPSVIYALMPNASESNTSIQLNVGYIDTTVNNVQCKFNEYIINGSIINENLINCTVPQKTLVSNSSDAVFVELNINGKEWLSSNFPFYYVNEINLQSVSIWPPADTYYASDTILLISQNNSFYNTATLYCLFNEKIVHALWVNSSVVSCKTPEILPESYEISESQIEISISQSLNKW